MIALLVRRDSPGPVLFEQTRVGKSATLFRMAATPKLRGRMKAALNPVPEPRAENVAKLALRHVRDSIARDRASLGEAGWNKAVSLAARGLSVGRRGPAQRALARAAAAR